MTETFCERLNEAMKIRNITQADLARKTNMSTARINQYVKGVYQAKQQALFLLATALNVNISWLMGNDVPMEAPNNIKTKVPTSESALNEYEEEVIDLLRTIPEDKRKDFLNYLKVAINMIK